MSKRFWIIAITLFGLSLAKLAWAIDIGQYFISRTAEQGGFQTTNINNMTLLDSTIGLVISIILGFVGTLFLVNVIYGGFLWLTAQGNDDKVSEGQKRIRNSAIGVFIVIAAFLISNYVLTLARSTTGKPVPPEQNLVSCSSNSECPEIAPFCLGGASYGVGSCFCYDGSKPELTINYCKTFGENWDCVANGGINSGSQCKKISP